MQNSGIKTDSESKAKKGAFDRARDEVQKQMILDPKMPASVLRLAIAITLNFNREEFNAGNGLVAFPGIDTLLTPLTGLSKSTILRNTRWLEARGHMRVQRRRKGNRRDVNLYYPLRKAVAQLNHVPKKARSVTPPSVTIVTPPSVTSNDTIPLTTSDLPLTPQYEASLASSEAAQAGDIGKRKKSGIRGSKVEQLKPSDTIMAECYRLARAYDPRGAPLVTQAMKKFSFTDHECLDAVRECIENGDDLGRYLWKPENQR